MLGLHRSTWCDSDGRARFTISLMWNRKDVSLASGHRPSVGVRVDESLPGGAALRRRISASTSAIRRQSGWGTTA